MQIHTLLQNIRRARGLSAAELAKQVDVSRQTIYAIEDGSFVPNTAIALRLARVLDVSVEEIFALDQPCETRAVDAELLAGSDSDESRLVRLCSVNERLIAVPIPGFPTYLPAADGTISAQSGSRVSVEPAVDLPQKGKRLLLAGCDPALSLLAEGLESSGIEMIGVPCSSRRALEYLKQGRVHTAGSHLRDSGTGDYNVPLINKLFPGGGIRIVTFAVWEQGLVLSRGNRKNIRNIPDLADKQAIVINREKGSGSRDLLDKGLRKAGIAAKTLTGYDNLADGHLSAAYAVAIGDADCCVATRSAARRFGLDFIPLAVERFDLTFSKASLDLPAVKTMLDLLNRATLKRKLETIAGYDTAHTGEVLM